MSDEYEAAIEGDTEAPGTAVDTDTGGDDSDFDGQAGSGAVSEVIGRRTHVPSAKVRELFKVAAASIKEQVTADDEADEYEAAIDNPDPITPAPAVAPVAAPPAVPGQTTAAPAPSLDPAVLAKVQQLDARTAELDAREQAITARQQAADAGDFGKLRDAYFDKGSAHAIVELVKQWTGATTEAEVQDEVADLITELSGHTLGVAVPQEVKTRLDAKRALKGVKSHQAKLDAREAEIAQRQTKAAEQANIQRAVTMLDQEVRKPELATQLPFLTIEPNAGELIYETVEAQFKRDGTELRWMDAAKRVNDYLETKWREEHGKRAHLLTASPAPAGGAANGASGRAQGDPQGIRRSHTLTNAAAASAPTPPREPAQPANGKWSQEDHRARTKAKMRQAFKPPST